MGQVAYKIPRFTDEQIHSSLSELAVEFGNFSVSVQVGDAHIGQISYPEASDANLSAVLAQKSDLIFHFAGSVQGVMLIYYRGGAEGALWNKSPIFDDLAIDIQGFDPNRIKIAARILALFRPVQLPRPSDPISLLESQRALQESSFSRLQQQLEKVFEQTINLRGQLDEQVRSKEAALEDEFKQRQLDASQLIQGQTEELEKRERELDERRKSLDESDNTFARRQIRDRMLSDVSARVQNFGLSPTTVKARHPVAVGMGILCIFLFGLLVWTSFELFTERQKSWQVAENSSSVVAAKVGAAASSSPSTNLQTTASAQSLPTNTEANGTEKLLLWIRFSLVSVGLAASILYYIRWQNQWASTFASTEQSLQQFHIDVNRANWVVETCLEWRKETNSDIPAPLIESLTRGLFAGRDTSPAVLHPADELASALMGSASKLSLDLSGNKLEIDKPGKIPKTVKAGTAVATDSA
jgi:Skp family chaperone for outer membrane proteins